jgi:hypothetical protein
MTEWIENKIILNLLEHLLNQFMNEGEIKVSSLINDIEEDEERSLITELSTESYSISSNTSKIDKYSIFSSTKELQYSEEDAKILVKKLSIRNLERKIANIYPDEEGSMKIYELKVEINKINDEIINLTKQTV